MNEHILTIYHIRYCLSDTNKKHQQLTVTYFQCVWNVFSLHNLSFWLLFIRWKFTFDIRLFTAARVRVFCSDPSMKRTGSGIDDITKTKQTEKCWGFALIHKLQIKLNDIVIENEILKVFDVKQLWLWFVSTFAKMFVKLEVILSMLSKSRQFLINKLNNVRLY